MIFGEAVALHEPWSWTELVQTFRLFCLEAKKPHHDEHFGEVHPPKKLVFFIDGLDEFDGSHSELISFIKGFLGPSIKVCVSSRPWNVFEDAFKNRPSLRLEDLTFADIRHYVQSKLSENPGFAPLQELESEYAAQLIENVTFKASGVFLWVYLVTKSLLEGLSDGERLSDLQRRLDSLPADLERLFWRMLDSLSAHHFERSSQLFQIYRAAVTPLSVLQLSFADEDDFEYAFRLSIAPFTKEQRNSRAELMRRRLNACCNGLLEVQQDLKGTIYTFRISSTELADVPIGYLHRTVKDFLQKPDVWSKFLGATQPSFNPDLRLSAAYISELKTSHMDKLELGKLWDGVTCSIEHVVRSNPAFSDLQVRLVDEIDRTAVGLTSVRNLNGKSFLERCSMPGASSIPYWTCIKSDGGRRTSFLHLATEFQLIPYLKVRLSDMPPTERIVVATSILETAIKDAKTIDVSKEQNSIYHEEPNADLICMLLDFGADMNQSDLVSIAVRTFQSKPDVIRHFLLRRANPNNESFNIS